MGKPDHEETEFDVEAFNVALGRPIEPAPEFEEWQEQQLFRQNHLAGLYDAEITFKHLMEGIEAFESNLGEGQEVGIKLANFGEAAALNIREIFYKNPHLIEFRGVNTSGDEVMLIQHINQLNFMLIAVKPPSEEETPYRIGFRMRDEVKDEAGKAGNEG